MPTFIKTGYWEKAKKGLKGYLDLDFFFSTALSDANTVTSSDIDNIVTMTQTEYDTLASKSATTMYVILEE